MYVHEHLNQAMVSLYGNLNSILSVSWIKMSLWIQDGHVSCPDATLLCRVIYVMYMFQEKEEEMPEDDGLIKLGKIIFRPKKGSDICKVKSSLSILYNELCLLYHSLYAMNYGWDYYTMVKKLTVLFFNSPHNR